MTKPVVGIDVGKEKLDVGLVDEKRVRVWANDEPGRAELSDWIVGQGASLVVVEASGGYEAAIVSELVGRGQAVALVNPTRVRAFARAEGVLAKTDKIDAQADSPFWGHDEAPGQGQARTSPSATQRAGHPATTIGADADG